MKSSSPRLQSFSPFGEGRNSTVQSRWIGVHGWAAGATEKGAGKVPAMPLWAKSGAASIWGSRSAYQAVCSTLAQSLAVATSKVPAVLAATLAAIVAALPLSRSTVSRSRPSHSSGTLPLPTPFSKTSSPRTADRAEPPGIIQLSSSTGVSRQTTMPFSVLTLLSWVNARLPPCTSRIGSLGVK